MSLAKQIRILVLLLLLLFVIVYTKAQLRFSTSWETPLEIVIYPVNIDKSIETTEYIATLDDNNFKDIDQFISREGKRWNLPLSSPVVTRLGSEIEVLPPSPPDIDSSVLSAMLWSLQFRYWAWVHTPDDESNFLRIRTFVRYHQAAPGETVRHSVGLNKGLLAYVNAFASADQSSQNNIVIMHEVLHTVGATDKYDATGEPVYPQGYATIKQPLFPQKYAEIMAGRTPVSPAESYMPDTLADVVIGKQTAAEINWKSAPD